MVKFDVKVFIDSIFRKSGIAGSVNASDMISVTNEVSPKIVEELLDNYGIKVVLDKKMSKNMPINFFDFNCANVKVPENLKREDIEVVLNKDTKINTPNYVW